MEAQLFMHLLVLDPGHDVHTLLYLPSSHIFLSNGIFNDESRKAFKLFEIWIEDKTELRRVADILCMGCQ